jgi:hypothetical protein
MREQAESRAQKAEREMSAFSIAVIRRFGALLLLSAFCVLLLFGGCTGNKGSGGAVLAKVGSHELTKSMLSALAGMPADSLSRADRVRLVNAWIERALVDLEGEHRHLNKDPGILAKLESVRSELYRSKLLAELPSEPPSDSVISAYYDAHRQEFLRPMDVYSIELYWTQTADLMSRFRLQLMNGDTSMVAAGDVTSEGKWLAEAGEMDEDLQREVSSLRPGEVTFPHPYEDGYRVVRLLDVYPAGRVIDLPAVRDEIVQRLTIEQSRHREESLMASLYKRYPVKITMPDSL